MGIDRVRAVLQRAGLCKIEVWEHQGAVVMGGNVATWERWLAAGYAAAGQGFRGVVNQVEVQGLGIAPMRLPVLRDGALEGKVFDVAVIGGGVIGCAIARELSRWDLKVAVLEKEEDVAKQTSSRNNGMVHPGLVVGNGGLKIKYNIRGNRMYGQAARELGFKLVRTGSLVLLARAGYRLLYPFYWAKARRDGVEGIKLLNRREVFALEPNAWPHQQGALSLPSTGVVDPAQVTIAYGENAVANGVEFFLNTAVTGFKREGRELTGILTNRGECRARVVVNAAGVWADRVAELAGDCFFTIHPRKGTIAILDKRAARHQHRVLALPKPGQGSHTKGGGLNPTAEGNLLLGPTAVEVPQREDWSTTPEEMEFLLKNHLPLNTKLSPKDIITYFAGIRACTFEEDFIIEASRHVSNLVHVAGIQSPGLASAPAIAVDVAGLAVKVLKSQKEVRPNPRFNPQRLASPKPGELSLEERTGLIRANAAYGRIVCRCEEVSEGEVIETISAPLPALTLDGIKRRTRAGMGRCQGGFCAPTVLKLIAREGGIPPEEIEKGAPGSRLVLGETKAEGGVTHESAGCCGAGRGAWGAGGGPGSS
jgi:glycerol-3-phosphate dehydrogenase